MRRTLGRMTSARLNTMLHHPTAARLAALRARDGLVHVCGWCRKVRTAEDEWVPAEPALLERAVVSRSFCKSSTVEGSQ